MPSHEEGGVPMGNDLYDQIQASAETFDQELQNGIFSLVITWCQQKSQVMPMPQAKSEVAKFLEELRQGLLFEDNKETIKENIDKK